MRVGRGYEKAVFDRERQEDLDSKNPVPSPEEHCGPR